MRRIFKRLEATSTDPEGHAEADQLNDPEGAKVGVDGGEVEMSSGAAAVGVTNHAEPGKNVPTPDVHADDHTVTVPNLVLADQSPPADNDKSKGFNPYDTAVFPKK